MKFKIFIVTLILVQIIVIVHGIHPAVLQTEYEFCYSNNDEEGRCVSFTECHPYLQILSERPLLKSHLRLVVNLTCTFDLHDPLICCPLGDIVKNPLKDRTSTRDIINVNGGRGQLIYPSHASHPKTFQFHPNFHLLPFSTDCSPRLGDINFSIGQKVNRGDFPFVSLLGYQNPSTKATEFLCGATVINSRYLLTSAKCTKKGVVKPWIVRLGEHDLVNNPDCSNTLDNKNRLKCSYVKEITIEKIIPHPQYEFANLTYFQPHDIALIRLSQDISFNDFVQPVCLPFIADYRLLTYPDNLENAVSLSVGWGKQSSSPVSTIMRHVPQQIKSNEKCATFYAQQQHQSKMTDAQICSGGACAASRVGGPLLIALDEKYDKSKLFQVGITSFGPQFCSHGIPSVHTKVTSYLDWILNSIEP